jgi:hypothetical protein
VESSFLTSQFSGGPLSSVRKGLLCFVSNHEVAAFDTTLWDILPWKAPVTSHELKKALAVRRIHAAWLRAEAAF